MLRMIREVHDSLSKPATASSPLLLNQCHKFFCISSLHDTNYRIFINICIYIYFNYIAAGILYFKPVCDFLCLNPGVENKIYKYKYSAATRSELLVATKHTSAAGLLCVCVSWWTLIGTDMECWGHIRYQ